LVPLDKSCLNDEVHEDALVPLYESVVIEQTHQQEVRFSSKDAEELDAKVTEQEQYKKSLMEISLRILVLLEDF